MKKDIKILLKEHFGYDEFRNPQEDIINNIISGKDTFVLMPTGGGKSLCYQLPALVFEGLTIVVSPLIALMKDQVDSLKANGIAAEFVNSTLSSDEISNIYNLALKGKIKILYIAPERYATEDFKSFLKNVRVSLFAIDEAHCISEWGHDFRPDYRNLSRLRKEFPNIPIVALTATATDKVRSDILNQLGINSAQKFSSSFNRANLSYFVEPKVSAFDQIILLLEKYKNESAIIYCFSRKETERLAELIQGAGFKVLPYHAGLDNEIRRDTQEKFIRDEVKIITATIAFGMGIDKPNVRLVIHNDLPKSIEGYYQETGRAGRDGLPSECVLFYAPGDQFKQEFFIRQIEDEKEKLNATTKLKEVTNYCESEECRRKFLLGYFGEIITEENCKGCDICLTQKEEFDATIIIQKILSAVIRTGERFGESYIANLLIGKKTKVLTQNDHDKLSVFGIEKEFSDKQIRTIIAKIISKGLLEKSGGDYPVLKVTDLGRAFIKDRQSMMLTKLSESFKKSKTKSRVKTQQEYNVELFEKLRILRKTLADEAKVPPFVIFGDNSLVEMCQKYPQSLNSFSQISGVGQRKLELYGDIFLREIKDFCETNNIKENLSIKEKSAKNRSLAPKSGTAVKVMGLLKEKAPLQQIAKLCGVAPTTVISHIERIKFGDTDLNIEYLKPESDRFKRIKDAFTTSGQYNLTPVKNILGDEFSFDEIRIARMFLGDE